MEQPLTSERTATVVVLGDLARSPRILFHSLSFAARGCTIQLIGYTDRDLPDEIVSNSRINVESLGPSPKQLRRSHIVGQLVHLALRIVKERLALFRALLRQRKQRRLLLIQNPPGIAVRSFATLLRRIYGTQCLVDWHNFGSDILATRLGNEHFLVRIYRRQERRLARSASQLLCVSGLMRQELGQRYGVHNAAVLHDFPRDIITSKETSRQFFARLEIPVEHQTSRIIVCPSSWTHDEDISLVISAVQEFDRQVRETVTSQRPTDKLLIFLTGDGPRLKWGQQLIESLALANVDIRTLWLSYSDYQQLLTHSDLGICVHRSASGVDLPMKIADFEAAQLTPSVLDYGECIRNRMRNGKTGLLFTDASSLASILVNLATGELDETLNDIKQHTSQHQQFWQEEWNRVLPPLLPDVLITAQPESGRSSAPEQKTPDVR